MNRSLQTTPARFRAWKPLGLIAMLPFWFACKAPNLADLIGVDKVNEDALSAASHALCTPEESLEARPVSADETLEQFPRDIVAFGFFKGTSGCALTADYKQDSALDGWFSITLQDNCLINGSVWNIKNIDFPDHTVVLELSQVKRTPDYIVKINAGEKVSLKDLADASGMLTYSCKPKSE